MIVGRPAVAMLDGITLTNSSRQAMWIMLLIGCVLLAGAGVALGLQWEDPARFATTVNTAASAICLLALALCGPGALAMFVCALITLRPVLVTDRAFDRFRCGEMVADWRFTAAEWDGFVTTEAARLANSGTLAWLWLVAPFAAVAGIILWTVYPSWQARTTSVSVIVVLATLAFWSLASVQRAVQRQRIATMRQNPRVLIGDSSIYCGGFFKPWNVSMLVLQGARLLPGSPIMLEVTVGASQAVQVAGTVLAVASLAGGGSVAGFSGSMQSKTLVPVPAAREKEAANVVQQLLSPRPVIIQPTNRPLAPDRLPGQRRGSRYWWVMTAVLFGAGLGLFILGGTTQDSPDTALASLGTSASVAGLFLWIGGMITAVIAFVATIRSARSRAHSPAGFT